MYLENVNGPEDIKKLKIEELTYLADETRKALINKIRLLQHENHNMDKFTIPKNII